MPKQNKKSAWKYNQEWEGWEIEGLDCVIGIEPRPAYCDRGNFLAQIDLLPGRDALRLKLDSQDAWPRYYMTLDNAKEEIELWMRKLKQWIE